MASYLRGKGRRPNIWAHRGASFLEMENTMVAFKKAVEMGADGIELDVRLTRDDEVIVFHDDTLKRQFGKNLATGDLDLNELREETKDGFYIPTLKEVLDELGNACLINVEIKKHGINPNALVKNTMRLIAAAGCRRSVLISSFDPTCLALAAFYDQSVCRALLVEAKRALGFGLLAKLGQRSFAAVHPQKEMVSAKRVNAWHKRGQAIHAWTVDDPNEMVELSRLGVDSIITNRPDVALECLSGWQ